MSETPVTRVVNTECTMSTDCMCAATKGRPDPTCVHYRTVAHVEVPKAKGIVIA